MLNHLHNKWYYVIALFILFGVAGIFYFINYSLQEKNTAPVNNSVRVTPSSGSQSISREVEIQSYSYSGESINPPESLKKYTFKTSYTTQDLESLAEKLKLTGDTKSSNNVLIFSGNPQAENAGMLVLNPKTGVFKYDSFSGVLPEDLGVISLQTNTNIAFAQAIVNKMALDNGLIFCVDQYTIPEDPESRFVECHRDWDATGLPILGYPGIIAIPEKIPLSTLQLGKLVPGTKNFGNSYTRRADDFNTITFQFDLNNKLKSIFSNIRWITRTEVISKSRIIDADSALEQIKKGMGKNRITTPAGEGNSELVYAGTNHKISQGVVTDVVLVYLERSPVVSQEILEPVYLFRGKGEMENGHTVIFSEYIPAVN